MGLRTNRMNLIRVVPAEGLRPPRAFSRQPGRSLTRSQRCCDIMKNHSLLCGLALLGLAAFSHADSSADAKTPTLTVYTYDSFASDWGPGPKIKEAFEAQCGCTLSFVATDSSTGILSRVQLEGGNSPADIVLGLDATQLSDARATGLLSPHGVDTAALELPVDWQDDTFVPFDYGYFSFIYDSSKLDQVPASLDELAASDLKIIIQDPRSSTPGLGLLLWVQAAKGEQAANYWPELADNVVTVTKGWSEAYGLFLEGESDMVLSYTTSPAYHMIAESKDQYRAAAFSDGHGIQIEVAAKLASAPQAALADQFMAFILSDSFQSVIPTGNWMYPVTAVPTPDEFSRLVEVGNSLTIDADSVHDNKKTWLRAFNRGISQ